MAATFNAYFENNDIKSIYNYTIGGNNGMNNLAGWAGDLQQCIQFDIINHYDNTLTVTEQEAKNRAFAYIGESIGVLDSHFNLADLYADMDAINLYYLYKNNTQMDLRELLDYYFNITNNNDRYDSFIVNLCESSNNNSFEQIIYNYAYPLSFGCLQVYDITRYNNLTENIAKGASAAFTEIIIEKRK